MGRWLAPLGALAMRIAFDRLPFWLHQQINASILRGSHDKLRLHLPTEREEIKHIAVAIPHMNPLHALGRPADALHRSFPDLRLAGSLLQLPGGFALGSRLAQKRFLMGYSHHFFCGRIQREHALQQKSLMTTIANGS